MSSIWSLLTQHYSFSALQSVELLFSGSYWELKLRQGQAFLRREADLLSSIAILVADSLFLLGKTFTSFPQVISQWAFLSLNAMGLLYLPFNVDLFKKTREDLLLANKGDRQDLFIFAALKLTIVATTLLLTCTSLLSAMQGLLGYQRLTRICPILGSIGTAAVFASLILDVWHYRLSKEILAYLTQLAPKSPLDADTKICKEPRLVTLQIASSASKYEDVESKVDLNADDMGEIFRGFKEETFLSSILTSQAAAIRILMDKDTWSAFKARLNLKKRGAFQDEVCLLKSVMIENIRTQQTHNIMELVLKIFGYLGMIISSLYPDTFWQALIWTVLSAAYTIQLIAKKRVQTRDQLICKTM